MNLLVPNIAPIQFQTRNCINFTFYAHEVLTNGDANRCSKENFDSCFVHLHNSSEINSKQSSRSVRAIKCSFFTVRSSITSDIEMFLNSIGLVPMRVVILILLVKLLSAENSSSVDGNCVIDLNYKKETNRHNFYILFKFATASSSKMISQI
jgi:hypothetical protein